MGTMIDDSLTSEVRNWVKEVLSPIAAPDFIQWNGGLPKTRPDKIIRSILRKIAINEIEKLGDTSALADPEGSRRTD
jgi:acetyl-CoA synthetase